RIGMPTMNMRVTSYLGATTVSIAVPGVLMSVAAGAQQSFRNAVMSVAATLIGLLIMTPAFISLRRRKCEAKWAYGLAAALGGLGVWAVSIAVGHRLDAMDGRSASNPTTLVPHGFGESAVSALFVAILYSTAGLIFRRFSRDKASEGETF